jgi:BASS family bile acid:Na+ symporter
MQMPVLSSLAAILSWLGRQGTRAVAALVFIGIAVPSAGALLKPFITEAVFLLLSTAFLCLDISRLRGYMGRPLLVLLSTAWNMLAMPFCFGLVCLLAGVKTGSPHLHQALMLQMVASPMMASPALAALMGLDATLVLVNLVLCTALVPLTAPLFAYIFIGPGLSLSPSALGLKLFVILAGSALLGLTLRRFAGAEVVARHQDKIDGLNVLALFVFVAAVMENVGATFGAEPMKVVGLTALAFGVFFASLGLTFLVFMGAGRGRAFALGLVAAQRNVGLMLAATGGALPGLTWLYFALAQFPYYLSPQILKPLARRLTAGADPGQGPSV